MNPKLFGAVRRLVGPLALMLALHGCGGGGDSGPPPLPATLAITSAAQADAGTALAFTSNLPAPVPGWTVHWDFNDGSSSNEATPSHHFAATGDYTVVLSVRTEAGEQAVARQTVQVRHRSLVQNSQCSAGSGQGWCWQRPRPNGNAVQNLRFFSNQQAWAVGDAGTLLKSNDSGQAWTTMPSGVTTTLRSLHFFDADNGWVMGDEATLLRTRDGGVSWQAQATGESPFFGTVAQAFQSLSAETAVMIGASGLLRVTRDGGDSWESNGQTAQLLLRDGSLLRSESRDGLVITRSTDLGQSFNTVLAFNTFNMSLGALRASDAGTAWVVSFDFNNSQRTLWVSGDNGATWRARAMQGLATFSVDVDSLVLFSDGGGWAQDGGRLWRTQDGGDTWTEARLPPEAQNSFIFSRQALDSRSVVINAGFSGTHVITRDGGATWSTLSFPPELGLFSLQAGLRQARDGALWLLAGGRAYRSSDGGAQWTRALGNEPSPNNTSSVLGGLWFGNAAQGMAVSAGGWALDTRDGGVTWARRQLTPFAPFFGRALLQVQSTTLAWLNFGDQNIYRSTDGGQSWFAPLSAMPTTSVRSFHFSDERRGLALQDDMQVLASTDGGGNWSALSQLPFQAQALRWLDAQTALAVGDQGAIARSTDGGATWRLRASGTFQNLRKVLAAPDGGVWALGGGGTLLKSTDQGLSWTRLPLATQAELMDMAFGDALHAWLVGSNGTVLATSDGGATWTLQASSSAATLVSVYALDAYTAWIGTSDGGVLVTATGGR